MGWMNRDPAEPELPNDLGQALSAMKTRLADCPKPELLHAAQSDVLPAQLAQRVKQHMEGCSTCKALLADLEAVDDTPLEKAEQTRIWKKIQTAIAAEEPAVRSGRAGGARWNLWFRPVPLGAIAAALVLIAVGALWLQNRRQRANEAAQNHQVIMTPTTPSSVLQLEKAPVVLPASATIVWRGQKDASGKQIRDLQQALVPYEAGDYDEAVRRLQPLRVRYPKIAAASFYLGVSQLFLNRNEEAARSLKHAANTSGSPVATDALWYLALANHRLGKDDLAVSTLETLCKGGGRNSARACEGAKELAPRR